MKKKWWTSKTLITAAAAFIVVCGSEMAADPAVAAMIEYWVALLLPVVMAALRSATSQGIR